MAANRGCRTCVWGYARGCLDIRSRTANDAGDVESAQKILGDGAAIRVYRRGPQKVNPVR